MLLSAAGPARTLTLALTAGPVPPSELPEARLSTVAVLARVKVRVTVRIRVTVTVTVGVRVRVGVKARVRVRVRVGVRLSTAAVLCARER